MGKRKILLGTVFALAWLTGAPVWGTAPALPFGAAPVLASDAMEPEGGAQTVRVKVTATQLADGMDAEVAGATVSVYSGQGEGVTLVGTYETGADGYVDIQLPEAYASEEELEKLTFSAKKVAASGSGISGSGKNALLRVYGEDRLQLELHSETLDVNGNWLGKKLPTGNARDVDLAFVIDTTGSMEDNITLVKENITQFARHLEDQGLNLRMSVVEYRDIQEDGSESTRQHYYHYSPWFNTTEELMETLSGITVDGGGDDDETPLDALDILLNQSGMNWRSSAHKFAFVLTDAGYKTANSHGYGSLREVAELLYDDSVVTSVISTSGYADAYRDLYETTEGRFADISSSDFTSEMLALADNIIGNTNRELELHLQEPRLLVDYSLCYYGRDEEERMDDAYYNQIREMMKNASESIAKATDGHVLLNKVYLFSTSNRENFFVSDWEQRGEDGEGHPIFYANSAPTSAMADIRIMSSAKEKRVRLPSNAFPAGFYFDQLADDFGNKTGRTWQGILDGKKEFLRIELTGVDHNKWTFQNQEYSDTVAHESGHYVMMLLDEYLNGNKDEWEETGGRPAGADENFGLMDAQWLNLELSKGYDYSYLNGDFDNAEVNTQQSFSRKASCEDTVADLLCSLASPVTYGRTELGVELKTPVEYQAVYTKTRIYGSSEEEISAMSEAERNRWDRTASYPYARLEDEDFIDLRDPSNWQVRDVNTDARTDVWVAGADTMETDAVGADTEELFPVEISEEYSSTAGAAGSAEVFGLEETSGGESEGEEDGRDSAAASSWELGTPVTDNLADIRAELTDDQVQLFLTQNMGEELRLFRKIPEGELGSALEEIPVNEGRARISLAQGEMCELLVAAVSKGEHLYNTHIIERSRGGAGYEYLSADGTVDVAVIPEGENEYVFVTVGTCFKNEEYQSVNNGLQISSGAGGSAAGGTAGGMGEIVSVVSVDEAVDYTSITWFYYGTGGWMALDTTVEDEENMNIRATCSYVGEGRYALMAKPASSETLEAVRNLSCVRDTSQDGIIYVTFDDPNQDILYYDIYYSTQPFSTGLEEEVAVKKVRSDQKIRGIDLGGPNVNAYVGVSAINRNGARSPLTGLLEVNTGEVDRDGDGIPDWYCDRYLLWPRTGVEKDIAENDEDGDGLTNLEEYQRGSDPVDQNDPVRTEKIAAASVTLSSWEIMVSKGGTVTVTASVLPAEASNRNVQWYVTDETIASLKPDGLSCGITGMEEGSADLTVVTEDGGFTATAHVTVSGTASETEAGDPDAFRLKRDAASIKYMSPYTAGSLKTNQPVTRYEALEALDKLFDIKSQEPPYTFSDVDGTHQELVNKFSGAGILENTPDGRFGGEEPISRRELARMLKILFRQGEDSYLSDITDGDSVTRTEFMENVDYLVETIQP